MSTSRGAWRIGRYSPDGKFTRSYGRTRYQSINLATIFSTVADSHNFTLMAGYQEEDNDYSYVGIPLLRLYYN